MNRRAILLITLLTLTFLTIVSSPAQAEPEQTVLSGRVKVTGNNGLGKCIAPDRLRICRHRASVIRVETNDARLTGEAFLVFDSISTKVPYTQRFKGDFRLDNLDGSWTGTWRGATDAQGFTLFTAEGQGIGDYEGLILRWQMQRSSSNWWDPMSVSGTINKGLMPARRR